MYTLKSIAKRGSALGMAVALFAATIVPTAPVFADELNPLTDRSLMLSSGSPGWAFTDGSGNSTYAPPNSGANGQKTGNTFSFKVSTDTTGVGDEVRTFTFQYCTKPAGNCIGPGDNGYTGTDGVDAAAIDNSAATIAAKTSDLEVVTASPSEANFATYVTNTNASAGQNPTGNVSSVPAATTVGGNYMVYYNDGGTWTPSTGWVMTREKAQDLLEINSDNTDKFNQIKLTKAAGQGFEAGQEVKVVFFGTNTNYITNPGSREFFVKINTYNSDTVWDNTTLVDGGVTVANVMNESIHITTKVLETMDFSVGVVDPYTLEAIADDNGPTPGGADEGSALYTASGNTKHGVCAPILPSMVLNAEGGNTLQLGDENGEFSLTTADTYSTHSYWRLSSNSSAGATVYYSGVTLSNTVNDKIAAIGSTATQPLPGSEQFGLALAHNSDPEQTVDYSVERDSGFVFENGADNATSGVHASVTDDLISDLDNNPSWHSPQLTSMTPTAQYGNGAGTVNNEGTYGAISTSFAFEEASNTVPVPIAEENTDVINCVTGKMRYIANIAATTPAGIYTTKINYIASPQY